MTRSDTECHGVTRRPHGVTRSDTESTRSPHGVTWSDTESTWSPHGVTRSDTESTRSDTEFTDFHGVPQSPTESHRIPQRARRDYLVPPSKFTVFRDAFPRLCEALEIGCDLAEHPENLGFSPVRDGHHTDVCSNSV